MPLLSRRGWTLLGVLCLVPLLNFPRALVGDRALFIRDISMVWAPQSEAVVQQVARGDFPFFDGKRAFGQPLFADPRSEVLYPPAWIHLFLRPDQSYGLFAAFHIVIAGLGAARLARRIAPPSCPLAPATAGLSFAASGPLLSLVAHWHHLAGAAWMPWIIDLADPRPGRPVPWLGLSGLVALQAFAGSPDYTFTTFALCFLRVATRTHLSFSDRVRALPALLLGLSLSAIQLLPSLAFAREAAREPLPIGWALSPLHPALTIETILPVQVESWPLRPDARATLFGGQQVWMFSHYLGLSVWVLAALGLTRAGKDDRRFLGGAVLLGLLLAWGVTDESLQRVMAPWPLVSGLRFPTKHLAAASLGLSVLAACGSTGPWPGRAPLRIGVSALLIGLACASLFVWSTEPASGFEFRALLKPALAFSAIGALAFAIRRPSRAESFLPALAALDLLCANASVNPTMPRSRFRDRPPLTSVIPRGSRIYVSDYSVQLRNGAIRTPPGPPYRLAQAPAGSSRSETLALAATWYLNPPSAARWGYFGSFDLDILDFYRRPLKQTIETFVKSRDPEFVLRSLQRGAVDYVVTMDPPGLWDSLPLVAEERGFFEDVVRLFRVPAPWPRARFETPDGSLDEGSPTILSYADGRIEVATNSARPSRLVLAVANEPGWRATIDGKSVQPLDNDLAFVTVPLSPGPHLVDLRYVAPYFASGAVISAASLLVVSLLTVRAARRSAVSAVISTPTTAEAGRNRNST